VRDNLLCAPCFWEIQNIKQKNHPGALQWWGFNLEAQLVLPTAALSAKHVCDESKNLSSWWIKGLFLESKQWQGTKGG